jgi:hypothetical protein
MGARVSGFDEAKFWPAMKKAGMLTRGRFALPGCPVETVAYVDYIEPDFEVVDGALSKQYRIEYQVEDLPTLAEGVRCVLELTEGEVLFRVRESPIVPDGQPTGFFRTVLLTRV